MMDALPKRVPSPEGRLSFGLVWLVRRSPRLVRVLFEARSEIAREGAGPLGSGTLKAVLDRVPGQ